MTAGNSLPYGCLSLLLVALCGVSTPSLPAAELPAPAQREVDFVKDVQPIFVAACVGCHGPVRQEGKYRLDAREVALQGGVNFAPNILPGKSAESPLIRFVAGLEEGMQMPARGRPLTAEQIGILRAWIDQGARWPDNATVKAEDKLAWWSLQPIKQMSPPPVPAGSIIDAFIRAKLAEHKLHPAPPAEPHVLVRRLYFDLLGLPPTPEEVATFLADNAPDAYERLVDRLIHSPHYGERWARRWMDGAHFAETHGHDQDRVRENAWPYRDYLIRAFHRDVPYSRFIREQIAGDTPAADGTLDVAALGFLAAGPWDESSLRDIREDTLDRQIGRYLDRDDIITNVMSNVVSLTVQCARCHDHKFDPITQQDYYSLQAVFAGVERAHRTYDADPAVASLRAALRARNRQLAAVTPELRSELLSAAVQREVEAWESTLTKTDTQWEPLRIASATSTDGATLTAQEDGSVLSTGTRPEKDTYTIAGTSTLTNITAVRLEVLAHDDLPQRGPGRQDNGNLHLSEFELYAADGKTFVPIARAKADFDQQGWDVSRAIDGNLSTAWGIYPRVGESHVAVFELKKPLELAKNAKLTIRLKQLHGGGHLIGRPRLAVTAVASPTLEGTLPPEVAAIIAIPPDRRTDDQRVQLALQQQKEKVARAIAQLPKPSSVYAVAADFEPDAGLRPPPGPRPIHVLHRGDIRQPRSAATAGALACVSGLPAQFAVDPAAPESARREALAAWLVHPQNPLTWRSIVNRGWAFRLGRGIVGTLNDFGHLGEKPTHPELLDWLALSFRDGSQSLQTLDRLLVTSDTYRQSSAAAQQLAGVTQSTPQPRTDHAPDQDSDLRWLWRMPRRRLDAECVHDALWSAAGRLNLRMGGPSDRQFDMRPGRHVTPLVDYGLFPVADQPTQRRSVYRFLFRTLPDPFMEALDCPAGDQIVAARGNGITVQQALALWNNAQSLTAAERLATRVQEETRERPTQIDRLFWLLLSRPPAADEARQFAAYTERHGLSNACRVLVNLNEFVFLD